MTMTVTGVAGSMDAGEWTQLGADMAEMAVKSGLKVSAAGGVRQVTVAAGRSYQAGTNYYSTAPTTLTLGTNTSGNPRIDTICVQVDLTLAETTAGSLVVVPGAPRAAPSPATLTQTAGSSGLWQTPLAYVTVVNNKTTAFTSAEIVDARPNMGATTNKQTVTISGDWGTDPTYPMYVDRVALPGGLWLVEFGGRIPKTVSDIAQHTTLNRTGVIPAGYLPKSAAQTTGVTHVASGTPVNVVIQVNPNGSLDITPVDGAFAAGDTARLTTVHWIGA